MTTANVAVKESRKDVYEKVESQLQGFEAQIATLKAKAESVTADAELKAIANLTTAKQTLDVKVAELKSAGETTYRQVKADVEARLVEFGKSLEAIASKSKAR